MPYKLSAKPGEEVWNRRQFVPRASFKTKTTTKALIGFHSPYFWILRPFLQPISIGLGIKSEENKDSEKDHCITPVVCQDYQILPQNYTPAVAAHFWRTSSHFFLFPWGWIYCGKKYGGRRGMALPTFLNCHAINELMTFWTFLAKSCYWNSFLLSFQDYLLLFTFFNHYINMGVFIPLIWVITACVQWTKGEGGKSHSPQVTELNSQSERLRVSYILFRIPISIR